jgi:hypothetical protein
MLQALPKTCLHTVEKKTILTRNLRTLFPTLLTSFQIPALIYSPTHIAWGTQLCKDMDLAKIGGAMCKNTTLKL